jgi:DnaJ domain
MRNFDREDGFNPLISQELTEESKWVRKYKEKWERGEINTIKGVDIEIDEKNTDDECLRIIMRKDSSYWTINGSNWKFPMQLSTNFSESSAVYGVQKDGYLWVYKMTLTVFTLLGWYSIQKMIDSSLASQLEKTRSRTVFSSQRKVLNHLLQRTKQESSGLILLANEEMAEMIDAIRKKSHQVFNKFIRGKTVFEDVQVVLEEAISDLLSLKEMLIPQKSDAITFDDILGVKPGDSKKEIQKTYKNLMQILHPDRAPKGTEKSADNITTLINIAYEHIIKNNNGKCAQ